MAYRLFILPDDADAAIEDFSSIDAAAARGAQIIRWEEPEWPLAECAATLRSGAHCRLGDAGTIYIEETK